MKIMKKKTMYAVFAALLLAAPAFAAEPTGKICIDPHWDYRANWLKGHQVVAQQTFGHDKRKLLLETTCYDLERSDFISLSTSFRCVDQGDDVFVKKLGGPGQFCKITHVAPYTGG
jgi:hypothetical protein